MPFVKRVTNRINCRARIPKRIDQRTAERRLNARQRAAFEDLFRSRNTKAPIVIITGPGAGDIGALVSDINAAAHSVGETTRPAMMNGVLPPGITFSIAKGDRVVLARLEKFAVATGLKIECFEGPEQPGTIGVRVGPRAPGLP
jgi:hypothetical protein